MKFFLKAWTPVFLWMALIGILSSVTGRDIPPLPIPFFHRTVHLVEYSVLGALCVRAFSYERNRGLMAASLLGWLWTLVFAFTDEWHQTFVAGRMGKIDDVVFDMICASFGILIYIFIFSRSQKQRAK